MGFLDRLFGKKDSGQVAEAEAPAPPCPHGSMAPHWDSADELGQRDKISFYTCDACGQRFTPADGEAAMAAAAEGVRIDESLRKTTEEMLADEKQGDV
jgi:hypothetical protein